MKDFLGNEIHIGDRGISTVKHYTELSYVEVVDILPKTLKIRTLIDLDHSNIITDDGTRRVIAPYRFAILNKKGKEDHV